MRDRTATLQRSKQERDRLVEQYLPLVHYIAARLPVTMPAELDRDDFFSVGVMGLMRAASTYDSTRGASFKTYAYTAIRGAILDEIRRHDPVPRQRRCRLRRMERAIAELHVTLGRAPTRAELDADLQAQHQTRRLSLDENRDGSSKSVAKAIAGNLVDPAELADHDERLERLTKAIIDLPEVERSAIVLYFHEQLYLKEIGHILGVSESRVSQILNGAIARLRLRLRAGE